MLNQIHTSLRLLLALTLLTGVVYPFLVTGIAQVVFPHQANGSLIIDDGKVVGSTLIGQSFSNPKYFWGRLSATSPVPYNAAASSGSNFGPLHPGLKLASGARISALAVMENLAPSIPVDLVTASASGLDPHISPAAAEFQVKRVAQARDLTDEQVRALITAHTHGRQLGIFGEPRVEVLSLNLALDRLQFSR